MIMNTNTMIKHALSQGTLMIAESPRRAIIGTLVRDLGDRVVLKVISAHGLRAGERITVRDAEVTRVTSTALAWIRAEFGSWGWRDADADDVAEAPAMWIMVKARSVYGSWAEACNMI